VERLLWGCEAGVQPQAMVTRLPAAINATRVDGVGPGWPAVHLWPQSQSGLSNWFKLTKSRSLQDDMTWAVCLIHHTFGNCPRARLAFTINLTQSHKVTHLDTLGWCLSHL
jgi:hypothetical protein